MTEGRPLALSPPPDPWNSLTLPLPQDLESWYLAKIFILSATSWLCHLCGDEGTGSNQGNMASAQRSHCSFPQGLGLLPGQYTPREGAPPPPRKHWVRSEDSTAAIPPLPSLPPSSVPASPQWFGPWEQTACGGIRISGKDIGGLFSLCENKVFKHRGPGPLPQPRRPM